MERKVEKGECDVNITRFFVLVLVVGCSEDDESTYTPSLCEDECKSIDLKSGKDEAGYTIWICNVKGEEIEVSSQRGCHRECLDTGRLGAWY